MIFEFAGGSTESAVLCQRSQLWIRSEAAGDANLFACKYEVILGYQADVALPATQLQLSIGHRYAPLNWARPSSLFDATLQLHLTKQCHPCVAFAFKKDRCWKGDACTHCHFCTPEEAKVRRRELQEQARKLKRVRKAVERAERGEDASLWL
eukprot:s1368_g15.t1